MTITPCTLEQNGPPRALSWRKILILNRSTLSRAWGRAFPMHDLGTGRLRRRCVSSFQEACDRAEAELSNRKPDPKVELVRRLLRDDRSFRGGVE